MCVREFVRVCAYVHVCVCVRACVYANKNRRMRFTNSTIEQPNHIEQPNSPNSSSTQITLARYPTHQGCMQLDLAVIPQSSCRVSQHFCEIRSFLRSNTFLIDQIFWLGKTRGSDLCKRTIFHQSSTSQPRLAVTATHRRHAGPWSRDDIGVLGGV